MSNRNYKAREGSQLNDAEAYNIGTALEKIRDKRGHITSDMVVKDAEKKRSVLHKYFEWDDKLAAHQHRLDRARFLIGAVVVEYKTVRPGTDPIRAFYSVDRDTPDHRYVTIDDVIENEDYRQQIIHRALMEAESWARRYGQYQELGTIITAIDKAVETSKAKT